MAIYYEDPEIIDIQMMQRVVGLFDRRPHIQRIIRLGLGMNYSEELDDSDHEHSHLPSVKAEPKESNNEAKEKLHESKKRIGRAEKKRLKKQKRKEKKRLEKLKKEENVAEKDGAQPSESDGSTAVSGSGEGSTSVKQSLSCRDTDSSDVSDDESSGGESKNEWDDVEELDLTSSFVNKAALIAKRQMEQKQRFEKKEKKVPAKETTRPVGSKAAEARDHEKKDSATVTNPTLEDNVKISTDLAVFGNKFASAGEFGMAVKYFTDAIKYNPTEYKLFGNRSFCFEKMQEYEKALTDAELCLAMFPGWVKGLYRKGRALTGLKRYEEAAQTFREVLKLDSSCAEAAQELMRVQIIQLMEYGFSREQSSNALIIHGTVKKALEVLSKLNHHPGATPSNSQPPVQVANVNGVSPVLSANANPPPHSHNAPNKPLASVHNTSAVPPPSEAVHDHLTKASGGENQRPLELFPVWVGNIVSTVTEPLITDLFSKAGVVYSVKLLLFKRCAFVNFTKQEYCDEAIKKFHGYELLGTKIAVRYPDRIPQGMGISRSALKADDLQDENVKHMEYFSRSDGGCWRPRPIRSYRHVSDHRNFHKH